MKGSPLHEVYLIVLAAALCWTPIRFLTRPVAHRHTPSHNSQEVVASDTESAWLDIRSSHPPESLKIFQGETVLWEGGGDLRMEADIELMLSERRSELDFVFRWSENVEQAYIELNLEAGVHPVQTWGFWSTGEDRRTWRIEWEESL